jgi:hypothetical protein
LYVMRQQELSPWYSMEVMYIAEKNVPLGLWRRE